MHSKLLPRYCTPGRALQSVDGIVLHYFSCRRVLPDDQYDMTACRRLFLDLNQPRLARQHFMLSGAWPDRRMYASAHVLIGRDGTTWKLVRFNQEAWHAGFSKLGDRWNLNSWTLGIELAGTIRSGFTRKQYRALAALVVRLQGEYGFPTENVVGHDQVRWNAVQTQVDAGIKQTEKYKYDPSGKKDGAGSNFDWWYFGKLCNDLRGNRTSPDDVELESKIAAAVAASPTELDLDEEEDTNA